MESGYLQPPSIPVGAHRIQMPSVVTPPSPPNNKPGGQLVQDPALAKEYCPATQTFSIALAAVDPSGQKKPGAQRPSHSAEVPPFGEYLCRAPVTRHRENQPKYTKDARPTRCTHATSHKQDSRHAGKAGNTTYLPAGHNKQSFSEIAPVLLYFPLTHLRS